MDSLNYKFDILAFSETKLQDEPAGNISLPGYCNPIHTFTEAFKGGVCFYISVDIDFKPRNDLKIFEIKKIELIKMVPMQLLGFYIDTLQWIWTNLMMLNLELLLSKLYCEKNKRIYLVGDFNFYLLKVNKHDETSVFFQ